jgi:hypothetical protein
MRCVACVAGEGMAKGKLRKNGLKRLSGFGQLIRSIVGAVEAKCKCP